jgi:hypothetical protein
LRRDAVSLAGQPSTSRTINAARCLRRQDLHCGEERELDGLALDDNYVRLALARRNLVQHRSGYGWSHGTSAKECIVVRRRELRRSMSRQTFVAMR